MERKLIDYLPFIIRDYAEMKGIVAGQQPEFEQAWNSADDLLANQFVLTAGDLGLSRWEKMLGIVPKGTDSLDSRRYEVLTRLNMQLPYTMRVLLQNLLQLAGEEPFTAYCEPETYILTIITQWEQEGKTAALGTLLEQMVPINMVLDSRNKILCGIEGSLKMASGLAVAEMISISDAGNEFIHLQTPATVPSGAVITETINLFD